MNEKRFLYLILTLIFLLMTIMNTLVMTSQIQREMHDFLAESEKLLYSMYQSYVNGTIHEENFPGEIHGVGLYNFYGDSLFTYGTAPDAVELISQNRPYFDKERNTVIMIRDLLDPFVPFEDKNRIGESARENVLEKARENTEEEKQALLRVIYLELTDSPLKFIRRRYRVFMGSVTVLLLMIVIYIGILYVRNLKYRNQIESQQRLVMLGTAARTLTHEVKNPLSSIRLQTSVIRRSGCGLHEPSLKIIEEEVGRLAAMTERVGDFLRHPEGNPCRTDLVGEVCRILGKKETLLTCPDLTGKGPLYVRIDPERFKSIADNLINNAVESGSDPSEILVNLERKGHEALFTVSDSGCGIDGEDLKHILDPFFTTKSRGSGVGLSIVQTFVQAVGGRLNIESEKEKGTFVSVWFPLMKDV